MSPEDKPYRIRVRVLDGKRREHNKLKGQLGSHLDVIDVKNGIEFVICALKEAHLVQVRAKLAAAGLEEIPGGDTEVSAPPPKAFNPSSTQRRWQGAQPRTPYSAPALNADKLQPKPYGFVPLADEMTTAPPIWHDGTGTKGRVSGEIRCEIETLTPLLVGWERQQIGDADAVWPVPCVSTREGKDLTEFLQRAAQQVHPDANDQDLSKRQRNQREIEGSRRSYINTKRQDVVDVDVNGVGLTIKSKSVLCPLRAPWGDCPVLIPGDSIKGLLRHELGALLSAPMERVAERLYSYRPNSLFPKDPNPRLVARLARVPSNGIIMKHLDPIDDNSQCVRVPVNLELLPADLKYYDDKKNAPKPTRYYRFDDPNGGEPYRGGQGAGENLNSKRRLHRRLNADPATPTEPVSVPEPVQTGYLHTVRHLVDLTYGHFSERHPDVSPTFKGETARRRILKAASTEVFQPGDLIWVEWDTQKECVVSLGWHYYYRWAYTDTVRTKGWTNERSGLFPLDAERVPDADGAPTGLSAVRRLFGYTGDNEGSAGIGKDDHTQLMGRISVNAAIEVIAREDIPEKRFLPPTFLKELGMPRPSAVEHYLKQPYYPQSRGSDRAGLVTYGDAAGYDTPGTLAGRKFYLDRKDAYTDKPWEDDSESNRLNERSTLALEASHPGRRFRFTIRFRDLDSAELAAVLVALCPHQFRTVLGSGQSDEYCSKLGYARPLGWGSVRIEAKALLLLDAVSNTPALTPVPDLFTWTRQNFIMTPMLQQWLTIHRCKHPAAADYPRGEDGNIYSYHTALRAKHTRDRRYKP